MLHVLSGQRTGPFPVIGISKAFAREVPIPTITRVVGRLCWAHTADIIAAALVAGLAVLLPPAVAPAARRAERPQLDLPDVVLVLRELRPEVAVVLLEVAGRGGRGAGGADGLLREDREPQVRGRAGGECRAELVGEARGGPELEGERAT